MPFELCNAPASFQRLMDLVLTGLQWSPCLVYLDDIILRGRSFKEHLSNLKLVFTRIQGAGLKLQSTKCRFLQTKVKYLSHIISSEEIAADTAKVENVASWPTPSSTRAVQQFFSLASYYKWFIAGFAEIARPLHCPSERTTLLSGLHNAWKPLTPFAINSPRPLSWLSQISLDPSLSTLMPVTVALVQSFLRLTTREESGSLHMEVTCCPKLSDAIV